MKTQTTIGLLVATALALTSLSAAAQGQRHGQGAHAQDRAEVKCGQKDFDRDRLRDRDHATLPARDRDRDQDRTHFPDNAGLSENSMYGSELMSAEERNQYREQLRLTESDPEARTEFKAQHREEMQARAKQQGVEISEPTETEEAE